jgi:predicted membrane channel-forming protein YqfA (hemolysin III family)
VVVSTVTAAPRALCAATYVALGWVALLCVPQLAAALPITPLVLIASGGLLYTVGAVVYALQRPDPIPAVFGYHEVFHALGVVPTVLVGLGGVLYTAGAVIYGTRRPDPVPAVFGYHEVFHLLVVIAAALQYAVVVFWVLL